MAVGEKTLAQVSAPVRLGLDFFNSLIRRIEYTKPLAGEGITLLQKNDGLEVSITPANAVTLTVCSAGEVKKLVVFYDKKRTDEANRQMNAEANG